MMKERKKVQEDEGVKMREIEKIKLIIFERGFEINKIILRE